MINVHDAIRQHIYRQIGLVKQPTINIGDLRQSEWCNEFEQFMRNRLVMGAIRYGKISDNKKTKHLDRVGYIEAKLKNYLLTGNRECMVDIANLAMLEFIDTEGINPFLSMDNTTEHQQVKEKK